MLSFQSKQSKAAVQHLTLTENVGVSEDPLRGYSPLASAGKSIFKMFYDLFSSDKTAALVYTNDIKVLIDMIVRQLTDLSPGEAVCYLYLTNYSILSVLLN